MKKALLLLSLLVLTVSLTACGGSSGHSSTPSTDLKGSVAAAPVKDAKVMVAFKYLTKSAQKASDKNAPIVVGTTNKDGSIKFSAKAVEKLDRSKNVIMYSVGGVKFVSEYNTVKGVKDAGAAEAGNLFNGQLRAVLAPKSNTAYLTVANTLVAAMVEKGATIEEAQKVVLNIVRNQLRVTAMKDIFGNPLVALTEAEVVSQSLLLTANLTEAQFAAAPTALTSYDKERFVFATVATRVKEALGTSVNESVLTKDAMMDTTPCAFIIDFDPADASVLAEVNGQLLVREDAISMSNMTFEVASFLSTDTTGYFVLTGQNGAGSLSINGVAAEMNKAYQHTQIFTFKPAVADTEKGLQEADKKAFTETSFTFAAVNSAGEAVANVDPITVTIRKISDKEIIVTGLTFTTLNREIEFENSASEDAANEDMLNVGEASIDNSFSYSTSVQYLNAVAPTGDALKKVRVRLVAPEGFAFFKDGDATTYSQELIVDTQVPTSTNIKLKRTSRSVVSHVIDSIKAYVLVGGEEVVLDRDDDVQVVTYEGYKTNETKYYEANLCGFAPVDSFGIVRDFDLKEGKGTNVANFTVSAKPVVGTVAATFTTWSLELLAKDEVFTASNNNDEYANDFEDTDNSFYGTNGDADVSETNIYDPAAVTDRFKAFAVKVTDVEYGFTIVGTLDNGITDTGINAANAIIVPATTKALVKNNGVATVVFNLKYNDGNAIADETDVSNALTFKASENANYAIRVVNVDADDVATTLEEKDLKNKGGVEVTATYGTIASIDAVNAVDVAEDAGATDLTVASITDIFTITITNEDSLADVPVVDAADLVGSLWTFTLDSSDVADALAASTKTVEVATLGDISTNDYNVVLVENTYVVTFAVDTLGQLTPNDSGLTSGTDRDVTINVACPAFGITDMEAFAVTITGQD